jgi:deoxyribonuclease-4
VLQTARITSLFGGDGVVFHAAFYLNQPRAKVYDTVKGQLEGVVAKLHTEGNKVWLRPEVMGKESEFGTVEEVLQLSAELEGVAPCLDFAHWHARTGRFNSYEEFFQILDQIEGKLGRRGLENMHIHVSGIDYGKYGEKKHLDLKESDFQYVELLRALKVRNCNGLVICESPNREGDALLLKQTYEVL